MILGACLHRLVFTQSLVNLDLLSSVEQERIHPPDDDVWQVELTQLGYKYIVVDVLESLGKIYKYSSNGLADVGSPMPMM